jgi:hypothetical protein
VPSSQVSRRLAAGLAIALVLALAGLELVLGSSPIRGTQPVPGPPSRAPGLADLWSGRASLVLARRITSTSLGLPQGGGYAGSHIEIAGGRWYLFNRFAQPAPGCPANVALGTQVRASGDRGRTWGPPTPAVAPAAGTPWACAATDGDAVYDAAAGTWRYLFQCMGGGGVWAGCYAERRAPDPAGPFAAPAANPVIAGGSLWSRICTDPEDTCHGRTIIDEGTFSLLPAQQGGWWVGFHGYDGTDGYRGIARTRTFAPGDWQVNGEGGTPSDAVLGPRDAAGWREKWAAGGPVGAGAASLAAEGGWYYQLAEVPDRNLGCTPGQNWDLGLFRARSPGSVRWSQLPAGNPIVYSSQAKGPSGVSDECNVEYPALVRDPDTGTDYVEFGRISSEPQGDGIFLYRLEWNRNVLANGDFWRADVEAWLAYPGSGTQLAALRLPDESPDGTPWLAFSCSGSCPGDSGLYQDVPVPERLRGRPVAFGGTFRAEAGRAPLDVALFQLDAQGRTLRTDAVHTIATTRWAAARREVKVDAKAATLRFQLDPRATTGYRADDLYVIPQDGCDAPRYPAC